MKIAYPDTGTTVCPHCGTRFKIAREQLEAHHGMVRCGHCQQAFDTRPNFAPEEIDPQLELPILDEAETEGEEHIDVRPAAQTAVLDPGAIATGSAYASQQPLTMADHSAFFMPGDSSHPRKRSWLWPIITIPLLLLLLAQATYLFRIDLAARLPSLKPVLIRYCQILKCSVPLPQKPNLMSIESSELKDDPAHRNQIMLIALLRNLATYTQALPDLELTLTDSQDNALARKILSPQDYLTEPEYLTAGLPANQELNIKLHLDTADLKPVGYRLVLFYSNR